jgi:2-polyprenyl-6-hydroxyphenyl methylase/3-demethylubiquinone-9 3-methyltransferase
LGPYEKPLTEIYRRIFTSLDSFSREIGDRVQAESILEVGCGEGMLTERLHKIYPEASITGIDISARIGRLFFNPPREVVFLKRTVQSLEIDYKRSFDLIVICDVLHHVPGPDIPSLLQSAGRMLKSGGTIIVKEWQKKWSLIYLLAYASDRWITGDRICCQGRAEWGKLLGDIFGPQALKEEFFVPPWSNNIAFQIRPE